MRAFRTRKSARGLESLHLEANRQNHEMQIMFWGMIMSRGSVRQASAKRTLRKNPPNQIRISMRCGMASQVRDARIEHWPIDQVVFLGANPRKNRFGVGWMWKRIRGVGFKVSVFGWRGGEVGGGALSLKGRGKMEDS